MALLIFNFDGTSNEPSDAIQYVDYKGATEKDNITNILKFHLLCGGNLHEAQGSAWEGSDQKCFYYHGIGTYGSRLKRLFNAAISPQKSDVATILNKAKADFNCHYQSGDNVLVTGFSRGGALARRFAALIDDMNINVTVYEAIFDTVAAMGMPNMSKSDRPDSDVVFEKGSTLPSSVRHALHMVSLDDKRKAFQPTLMNNEDKVTEVWFAGAHSDVGGGYYRDGLSDISLRFMLNWLEDLDNKYNLEMAVKTAEDIKFDEILPEQVKFSIGKDDVLISPNVFGKNHQQKRWAIVERFTLTDRLCCVIENDKVTKTRPCVHHSVAQCINGDSNYRPESLKRLEHQIIYADNTLISCDGVGDHIEFAKRNINLLNVNESIEVTAFAIEKYNHTGLMLQKNGVYHFEVKGQQLWRDKSHDTGAKGWCRQDVSWGLKEISIAAMEPFRRESDADWFTLIGAIGTKDDHCFIIGNKLENYRIKKSGEFCPFANDLDKFYGNNSGKLIVTVTRVE